MAQTTDTVLALLATFQAEYITAIKEGKDVKEMITSKPSKERFGRAPPAPSPELYAFNKAVFLGRKGAFPASMLKNVDATRSLMNSSFEPFCGRRVVEPKLAVDLEKTRGVKGYWIAWPGVDVSANAPTIIYFHGGGMFAGSALYLHGFFDRLSQITGLRVLTVEYRLCPEHTPMEAVADGVAAYSHVIEDLKVPNKHVFIGGESGGGQMTLLVAQAITRQGLKTPAAAWAISPVCSSADEDDKKYRVPTYERDSCHFFADTELLPGLGHLLRRVGLQDEIAGTDPRVSPLYGNFSGICPLYFSVGDTEIFVHETIATYQLAQKAGAATHLEVSPHGGHAYPAFNTPEAITDIAKAFAWMKQYSSL